MRKGFRCSSPHAQFRICSEERFSLSLVRPEEEVVGGVRHQLSLSHGASGRGDSSSIRIQALDKRGLEQEVPSRRTLGIPNGLQQQALNRAGVGAAVDARVRINSVRLDGPDAAAIERALPRRVPAERRYNTGLRTRIDALEVRDDLELRSEKIRKQGGFGAGGGVRTAALKQYSTR